MNGRHLRVGLRGHHRKTTLGMHGGQEQKRPVGRAEFVGLLYKAPRTRARRGFGRMRLEKGAHRHQTSAVLNDARPHAAPRKRRFDTCLRIGFFTCTGKNGKARIVPIGRPARKAVEKYIDVRDDILGDKAENALFLNFSKGRLTRQGLWKLFKYYGEKAGLDDKMINSKA